MMASGITLKSWVSVYTGRLGNADVTDSEYRLRSDTQPYCVFLAEVAPKTPIKSIRLKLLLFLQGSPFFDLTAAANRIAKLDLLKPELAVILGRVGPFSP